MNSDKQQFLESANVIYFATCSRAEYGPSVQNHDTAQISALWLGQSVTWACTAPQTLRLGLTGLVSMHTNSTPTQTTD